MSHVLYPPQFPLDCISNAIRIIRSGTIKDEAQTLALELWNIQGYAQATLIGLPPDQPPLFADLTPGDIDKCDELEPSLEMLVGLQGAQAKVQAEAASGEGVVTADPEVDPKAIDPTTIIAIIELAKFVLEWWKKVRPKR